MFETFDINSTNWKLLNQGNPDWRNDYTARWVQIGRQFTIPLLFWISGYSLELGKAKAFGTMTKVFAITVIGMLANTAIYLIGPMNDECSWFASRNHLKGECEGLLISFGIGNGAGLAFNL